MKATEFAAAHYYAYMVIISAALKTWMVVVEV